MIAPSWSHSDTESSRRERHIIFLSAPLTVNKWLLRQAQKPEYQTIRSFDIGLFKYFAH